MKKARMMAATVEYKVIEQGKEDFVINFEYHHQVKSGNGQIIDATESRDIRYHVENGLPILSERVYELDWRGEIGLGRIPAQGKLHRWLRIPAQQEAEQYQTCADHDNGGMNPQITIRNQKFALLIICFVII